MKEDNTLLAKWLAGKITPDELQKLQQEYDLSKLEQVLNRQQEFNLTTQPKEAMWEDFENRVTDLEKPHNNNNNNKKKKKIISGLILIGIFVLGAWFYFNKSSNVPKKIETLPTKTEEIQYADGTKIHISPNSSIEYDEEEWANQRIVNLKGPAYFEVEKGKPFTVLTERSKIEVLGTKFDIWEIDGLLNVQCFTGQVKITNGGVSKMLRANQQVFVNENQFEHVTALALRQADWLQAQRVYKKVPLRGILKDIERFYDVKIDASTVSINNDFGGVIPTNDLNKALIYLTKSLNWTYEIKGKTIYFRENAQ